MMGPMSNATPIQFFKPGRHTDMAGRSIAFSREDIAAMATAYDPALRPAPLVIGHPRTDDPAYGWVGELSVDAEGYAYAAPSQISDALRELVDAGSYKYVSASLYTPDSPDNPKPGAYYLRHIGFLGAVPPAVKGLRPVQFGASESGVVEFGAFEDRTEAGLFRRLRNWMIAKFGLDDADQALPEWDVQYLADAAAQPEPEMQPAADPIGFSEHTETTVTPEQAAALEAENNQLKIALATAAADAAARARAARHDANVSFAQGLAESARLPGAQVDVLAAVLDLCERDDGAVQFGEGDDARPLGDAVRELFAAAQPAVHFGEIATAAAVQGDDADADIMEFAAAHVDPERMEQHRKIRAHMRAHQVDYAAAARAVIK